MDLIGVLASLVSHSQTCPTSQTRQTPHKLVDLLTRRPVGLFRGGGFCWGGWRWGGGRCLRRRG